MSRILMESNVRCHGRSFLSIEETDSEQMTTDGPPLSGEASEQQRQGSPAGSLRFFLGEYEEKDECPLWPGSFRNPKFSANCGIVWDDEQAGGFYVATRRFGRRTSLSRAIL